jgi:hypothetical protein
LHWQYSRNEAAQRQGAQHSALDCALTMARVRLMRVGVPTPNRQEPASFDAAVPDFHGRVGREQAHASGADGWRRPD